MLVPVAFHQSILPSLLASFLSFIQFLFGTRFFVVGLLRVKWLCSPIKAATIAAPTTHTNRLILIPHLLLHLIIFSPLIYFVYYFISFLFAIECGNVGNGDVINRQPEDVTVPWHTCLPFFSEILSFFSSLYFLLGEFRRLGFIYSVLCSLFVDSAA